MTYRAGEQSSALFFCVKGDQVKKKTMRRELVEVGIAVLFFISAWLLIIFWK